MINNGHIHERRACRRYPVSINVKFSCNEKTFEGTIRDISAKGLLIKAEEFCFPFQSEFEVVLPLQDNDIHLTTRLVRIEMPPDSYDEIGLSVVSPPEEFIDFVESLSVT